ncbi:hypothetical protein FE634_21930 [Nocardioides dongxiaopingii]|uniref:Wzz/FepE/Etk N-terminal domain-containing protein n=1 Tax=Nocardioides sp. S-1144 TaxID=2582905 RepID=UPI0011638AC3|nr:Wzz/FepE/Etk N-terminal domain-containing protein [Nocardioides sp. S-1144]QDH11055.1 hypothetical protein FE634_21930 [Nocardioides sp. S-1144]
MTTPAAVETSSFELGSYLRTLRRRWQVVVVVTVLGVIVAAAYLQLRPSEVTATSVVNLNVVSDQLFSNQRAASTLIDTQTEAQLARSSAVLDDAAQAMGSDVAGSRLRGRTTVEILPLSTIVRISFSAPNLGDAVAGADAIAQAYLDERSGSAQAKISAATDRLEADRADLRAQLIEANTLRSNAEPGTPAAIQAASDAELINLQLPALVEEINGLRGVDTSGGEVVSSAGDNGAVVTPARDVTLATGAAVGFILGLILALLANRLDRRVYSVERLQASGGGIVLATLSGSKATIPVTGPDHDAFQSLRERLLAAVPDRSVLALIDLTTSGQPSDVGVNLALTFAESGRAVELVHTGRTVDLMNTMKVQLKLKRVPATKDAAVKGWSSWQSARVPELVVRVPDSTDEGGASAAALGELLANPANDDALTLVYLPADATRSLRLAAARVGHSIMLVVSRMGTRLRAVSVLADELQAVDAVVYGSLVVPTNRRLAADAAELADDVTTDVGGDLAGRATKG